MWRGPNRAGAQGVIAHERCYGYGCAMMLNIGDCCADDRCDSSKRGGIIQDEQTDGKL